MVASAGFRQRLLVVGGTAPRPHRSAALTLRIKTLSIVGGTLIGVLIILYAAASAILLNGVVLEEERDVHRDLQRALDALTEDVTRLNMTTRDYAAWDDTYAFIQDADEAYIQSNLVAETFVNNQLNLMLFINSSEQLVYGAAFNWQDGSAAPVPQSLAEHLKPGAPLLQHLSTTSAITGAIMLPEGPLLIASRPILTSHYEGPIRGTLIMGRYLDATRVEHLAEITHLALTIDRFEEAPIPPDLREALSPGSLETPVQIRRPSEHVVSGYTVIRDIYGRPALVLRVDEPRTVYQQGQISLRYLGLSVLVAGLVFGVMVWLLMEKLVLSRLVRLGAQVSRIGEKHDPSARVTMRGKDELSRVGGAINQMLEALDRSQHQVTRLNENLERRARELVALNKAGRAMTSTLDPEMVLKLLIDEVKSLLEAEGASVLLCEVAPGEGRRQPMDSDLQLTFAASTGPGSEVLQGTRIPITAGIVGWVMQHGQPAVVTDVQNDPRFYNRVDTVTGMTTRSIAAVPLLFRGETLGAIEAINKADGTFSEHDCELLEALASWAAIAIGNAQLYATEQQRVTALARALEQQRELERLQRDFIQNVSHELRTPLAIIQGYAELLENGHLGKLEPAQRNPVKIIVRRARLLGKLVDDIIAVLELEAQVMKHEPVDLAQLVSASESNFRAPAEEAGIDLAVEQPSNLPWVYGDSIALQKMVDNLIDNALKFTPRGGRVTVRLYHQNEHLSLQVTDSGVGIPEDRLERIFDRFYQVDSSTTRHYGGVGLGLALVKQIVEAHHGQITVASTVGQGTTFTVQLPVSP